MEGSAADVSTKDGILSAVTNLALNASIESEQLRPRDFMEKLMNITNNIVRLDGQRERELTSRRVVHSYKTCRATAGDIDVCPAVHVTAVRFLEEAGLTPSEEGLILTIPQYMHACRKPGLSKDNRLHFLGSTQILINILWRTFLHPLAAVYSYALLQIREQVSDNPPTANEKKATKFLLEESIRSYEGQPEKLHWQRSLTSLLAIHNSTSY